MGPSLSLRPRFQFPPWRVCICVLLIGLVIYNPFAALNGSSGRLSYDRLARNRAAVGSSELQHFSPVSNPDVPNEVEVEIRGVQPVRCEQEHSTPHEDGRAVPQEPALLTGVWFRPPPSL